VTYREPDDTHVRREAADDAAELASFRADVARRRRVALRAILIACVLVSGVLVFFFAGFMLDVLHALTGSRERPP
jgi:hypothetical protein